MMCNPLNWYGRLYNRIETIPVPMLEAEQRPISSVPWQPRLAETIKCNILDGKPARREVQDSRQPECQERLSRT